MNEIIALVITLLIVVGVAIYLFRSLTKLFVGLAIAYFVFHIGFIWDYEKFDEKVPVMDYFKSEYAGGFKTWYEDLGRQREEYAMLDIDKIEKDIDSGIKTSIEKAKNMYNELDKEALIEDLFGLIKDMNYEIAKSELLSKEAEFTSQGVTPEEFNEIIKKLDEMATSMKEMEEKLNQQNAE